MRKKYGEINSINLIFNTNSRGVTFVEVLIAIAILGMAILPSVNVFT